MSVRSNNCLSYGLKSRAGSCPYAPVAQGSGVLVIGGREFPIGKATGRNVSELTCSLVNRVEDADPVDVWGRPLFADWKRVHALRGRTSESRVRENRTHGLMREGWPRQPGYGY